MSRVSLKRDEERYDREDGTPWPAWSDNIWSGEKSSKTEIASDFYQDPQSVLLPASLKVYEWKRFYELDVKPILYDSSNVPDLFINNQHLCHSEFMRWFCSTLTILNYTKGANDGGWRGWHHVYSPISDAKSAKASKHNPQINPKGKYAIRLFFTGSWRRLEVDDYVPVDEEGSLLLPRTENPSELWPMLLAKGLLKISSLSSIDDREVVDFSPFVCLTGWYPMSLNVTHLSPKQRWELLTKYTKNCKQSDLPEVVVEKVEIKASNEDPKSRSKSKRKSKDTVKQEAKEITVKDTKEDFPVVTFLYLHEAHDETMLNIPLGYPVYVECTSDTPADPAQIKPPLQRWKHHRWIPWAIRKGIIDPEEHFIPIRRVLLLIPEFRDEAQWMDFNKFGKQAVTFHFLFKSEYFKCSVNISNVLNNTQKQPSDPKVNKKKVKEAGPSVQPEDKSENSTYYFYTSKGSRNEAIYLFTDSKDSKFFLFSYSVYTEHSDCSLVVERHSWFGEKLQDRSLIQLETKGIASRGLCLDPGRHLLRIFCQYDSSYNLTVSSDTIFHVGDRRKIQNLMTSECERLKLLTSEIKNCWKSAVDSFGSELFPLEIKHFYKSYVPHTDVDAHRLEIKSIHDFFKKEMINLMKEKCDENVYISVVRALRIFFVNVEIGRENLPFADSVVSIGKIISTPNPSRAVSLVESNGDDEEYRKNLEQAAASKIQAFFRMVRVKTYLEIHKKSHKEHEEVKRVLQSVFDLLDEESAYRLVRNSTNRAALRDLYPHNWDSNLVLQIHKMTGTASIPKDCDWTPIACQTLQVPDGAIVFAALDLFADLPVYSLRVFNNDSGREVCRIVNNVAPFHYRCNRRGYAVLAYASSSDTRPKEVQWCLHVTTTKGSPQFHLLNEPLPMLLEIPPIELHELSNVYIPNVNNYIAKAVLRVSECCCVFVRLKTFYSGAKIRLRVVGDNSSILRDISGGSVVLAPVVELQEGQYFIEAFVVKDSWPLTEDEWLVVDKTKKNIENSILMRKHSSLSTAGSTAVGAVLKQSPGASVENPRWTLQVLVDTKVPVELFEDTKRQLEILEIKESWKSGDSGRFSRGRNLQEEFCRDMSNENDFQYLEIEDATRAVSAVSLKTQRTLRAPRGHQDIPPLDFSPFLEQSKASEEKLEKNINEQNLKKYEKKWKHMLQHVEMVVLSSLEIPKL